MLLRPTKCDTLDTARAIFVALLFVATFFVCNPTAFAQTNFSFTSQGFLTCPGSQYTNSLYAPDGRIVNGVSYGNTPYSSTTVQYIGIAFVATVSNYSSPTSFTATCYRSSDSYTGNWDITTFPNGDYFVYDLHFSYTLLFTVSGGQIISASSIETSPPLIVLNGSATTTVEFGSTFTDPGATASDSLDGNITNSIQISGSVNTFAIGTSTLSYFVTNSHGLSATTTRSVVVACTHDCYSNVLFLPGIEGSRLYEGTGCGKSSEEKLWEPYESLLSAIRGVGNDKVRDLFLNSAGVSICSDIYAKENDVIDTVRNGNIYKSFIDEMNGMKSDGSIADWKSAAYDWRLSLDDLLNKGAARSGKIFYEEATSTPYIEQTLRALAANSKTGKVAIVAHSNGGLVAKALLNKLGGPTSVTLVDKVVMVGAPQSGAPESIGTLLIGHNAGIYKYNFPIVSNSVMREFAVNSPTAYHLLPSQNYFDSIMGYTMHPSVSFSGDAYLNEIATYGTTIDNTNELYLYLRGESLNSFLIDYANSKHLVLDSWSPPSSIEVNQIAGWGASDTLAGIDFYTLPRQVSVLASVEPQPAYKPIFTEDGDGIVPIPSALMMSTSTENVKRYWLDLNAYYENTKIRREHKNLFEVPSLRNFVKNIIKNDTNTLPTYISTSQPSPISNDKKLVFILHSPLSIQLTDSSGNVTGIGTDDSITQDIPNSTYGEFGDVKYIIVPEGNSYRLSMHGQGDGLFALDIQETQNSVITSYSSVANVPTTANSLATMSISNGLDTLSPLAFDEKGDGGKIAMITMKIGETVNFVPLRSHGAIPTDNNLSATISNSSATSGTNWQSTESSSTSSSSGSTTENDEPEEIATTTQQIATTTPTIVALAKAKKINKKIATVSPKKKNTTIPQTASVYDAVSQQSFLIWLFSKIYNGLHRTWTSLNNLF